MDIRIFPSRLEGALTPPPSKSLSHRAIIASALAGGESRVHGIADSQDIEATRRCMAALLGVEEPFLDCGESGSTLRFLIPLALALRGNGRFTGHGRLMERPQKPYFDIFDKIGVSYSLDSGVLTLRGRLIPAEYRLTGDISSQFVTGLLYALPLLDGHSEIVMTSPLESREYVTMTVDVLRDFGITIENSGFERFSIDGNQRYIPSEYTVEPDWSQAAFWFAANSLGCRVSILGLNNASSQGDMRILEYARALSADGDVDLDVSQSPDLVPPLAVMAAVRHGSANIKNAARLRLKESDRLSTVAAMLRTFGVSVTERRDGLVIRGAESLTGGVIDSANDHRIAMSAAIAAARCDSPVTILGAQAVNKSYPTFFDDYKSLGGRFDVL